MSSPSPLRPLSAGAAFVLLLVGARAFAQESIRAADPDTEETAELEAGDPVIHVRQGNLNRGEVWGLVDGSVTQVFDVVRDFDHLHTWYPDMITSRLLQREPDIRGHGESDLPWPFPDRTWDILIARSQPTFDGQTCEASTFEYIAGSGNLDEMHGYWLVCPYNGAADRSIVKYVLNADLGVWLPDFVISWATRTMLPGIIEGLRERLAG